MEANGWGAK